MKQIKQKPYTGKAYLFVLNGKVVANPGLRPTYSDVVMRGKNLPEWKSQHIKVERILGYVIDRDCAIEYIEGADVFDIETYNAGEGDYTYREVKIGQPCHIENGKVVKLLT